MKILLITDLYPVQDGEQGTPRTLYDFAKTWEELGHEVKIIRPNFILNSFLRKKTFYKSGQYGNVININYWLPFWGDIKKKLYKFYNQNFNPDIIIAHMPSGIIFADKLGLKFVAGIHCSDIEVMTKPLYSIYFKNCMINAIKNSIAISCRSNAIQNKMIKLFPEYKYKLFTAPSGIDKNNIVPKITHNIDKNNLKIITCANFKKRKNIDKLIYAVKGISGIELAVIGKGYEKFKKIDKSVKFLGKLGNEKVLEKMRKSDIFILPSINETFGMVYLEAMASGCITICSRDDGIDGIIKNGANGFVVNPNIEDIKKLIIKIKNMDNKELERIRTSAINTAKDFTKDFCSENYISNIKKYSA